MKQSMTLVCFLFIVFGCEGGEVYYGDRSRSTSPENNTMNSDTPESEVPDAMNNAMNNDMNNVMNMAGAEMPMGGGEVMPMDAMEPAEMGPPPECGPKVLTSVDRFKSILGVLANGCATCHYYGSGRAYGVVDPAQVDGLDDAALAAEIDRLEGFVNYEAPSDSDLLVQMSSEDHGVIYTADSPEYMQILNWIDAVEPCSN